MRVRSSPEAWSSSCSRSRMKMRHSRPASDSRTSGVQNSSPCFVEPSTSSACGAIQLILRATRPRRPGIAVERHVGHQLRRIRDRERHDARGRVHDEPHPDHSGSLCASASRERMRRTNSHQPVDRRSDRDEHVLLAHHRQQRRERAEHDQAAQRPSLPHPQPGQHEQRRRERRTRMRHRRRDVHVEEQRRADPYGDRRDQRQGHPVRRPAATRDRRTAAAQSPSTAPATAIRTPRIHTPPPPRTAANSRPPRSTSRPSRAALAPSTSATA